MMMVFIPAEFLEGPSTSLEGGLNTKDMSTVKCNWLSDISEG